nr:MAG TPA: hypothetical protein [Caudoviricetes sp.]
MFGISEQLPYRKSAAVTGCYFYVLSADVKRRQKNKSVWCDHIKKRRRRFYDKRISEKARH